MHCCAAGPAWLCRVGSQLTEYCTPSVAPVLFANLQGRHRAGDGTFGTQGWREDAALMQQRLLKQLMEILKTHLQVRACAACCCTTTV